MGNGMNKIITGVYVGNFRDAKDPVQLEENKITHILSIHDNAKALHEDKEYLCIIASDSPDQPLVQHFPECIDFIHKARLKNGCVLIHCLAGVSRSVTVTAAYLMTVTNLGWRDAVNAIRGARSCANPNFGFQKQLQDYENEGLDEARKNLRKKYAEEMFKNDQRDCEILLKSYYKYLHTGETVSHQELYSLPHRAYGERSKSDNKNNSATEPNVHKKPDTESQSEADIPKSSNSKDNESGLLHTAEAFSEIEFGTEKSGKSALEDDAALEDASVVNSDGATNNLSNNFDTEVVAS